MQSIMGTFWPKRSFKYDILICCEIVIEKSLNLNIYLFAIIVKGILIFLNSFQTLHFLNIFI